MNSSDDLNTARRILEELRREQLKIDLITGLGYALAVITTTWLICTIIEAGFKFQPPARSVLLIGAILLTLSTVVYLFLSIKRDPRLRRGRYAEEWWALRIGRSAPENIRDRLLNAIQVNSNRPLERGFFSTELTRKALYLVVTDLKDVHINEALDFSNRRKSLTAMSSALLILLLLSILLPTDLLDAANRMFHPRTIYANPPPFALSIDPAGGWAYRGEPVSFAIKAEGLSPERAEFVYHFDDGRSLIDEVSLIDGTGVIEFDGFPSDVVYFAKSSEVTSEEYRLQIIKRPQIKELQYRLFPPQYSRLPMMVGRENVGDVEALPGSRLEVNLSANKPLSQSWLLFQRSGRDTSVIDSLQLKVSGTSCTGQLKIMREGSYCIHLVDNDGHTNRDPITYRINLLIDDHPLARIAFPTEDVVLGDDMSLPLAIQADDDYGIGKIMLEFRALSQDSSIGSIPLNFDTKIDRMVQAEIVWKLENLSLFPGDVLEYWAIAWDNDLINGPKSGESERRLVRLPSMEEIVQDVEQSEEAGLEQAEKTLEAAKELKENISQIVEELKRNPNLNWEKQREMETAMQQQEDIRQQVEELAKRIDDLIEKLDKHDLITAQTLEKYQELQNLIAEISTPELELAMQKLREAMESQDPDKVREALEDFELGSEEYLEKIERSLNILQQLQLERKMDELVRMAEELLNQQEKILARVSESSTEELTLKQDEATKSMRMLQNNLQQTLELAEQAEEIILAAELDSISGTVDEKNIVGQMDTAAQAFSEERRDNGQLLAENSARDLAELSTALKRSANMFKERRKTKLAGKLRRLAEELILVSQNQETLTTESKQTGPKSPRYRGFAAKQSDIYTALQGVIARLFVVSQETFFITPDLGAALGNAVSQLERALAGYSDRNPRTVTSPQQTALGEINRSALKVLNIIGELEGASSSTGYEEMIERLSQMASSQQGLNEQTMMMPGGQSEQMMPGGSDQFAKMAAQQRALQQGMQQLSGDSKGMQEILGDLEGIASSMGDVADDLEDRTVNERTKRLQQRIVSRLLDATRSVKQQEYSRRRESKIGQRFARKSPPSLRFDETRERLRRDLLRALQEGYTRDYRELIRNYFQALEDIEEK